MKRSFGLRNKMRRWVVGIQIQDFELCAGGLEPGLVDILGKIIANRYHDLRSWHCQSWTSSYAEKQSVYILRMRKPFSSCENSGQSPTGRSEIYETTVSLFLSSSGSDQLLKSCRYRSFCRGRPASPLRDINESVPIALDFQGYTANFQDDFRSNSVHNIALPTGNPMSNILIDLMCNAIWIGQPMRQLILGGPAEMVVVGAIGVAPTTMTSKLSVMYYDAWKWLAWQHKHPIQFLPGLMPIFSFIDYDLPYVVYFISRLIIFPNCFRDMLPAWWNTRAGYNRIFQRMEWRFWVWKGQILNPQ
jgi:hypothetical protein